MIIREGEVETSNERILYPSITSCLTVTCIFPGYEFVGAHCVKVPKKHQKDVVRIALEMKRMSEQLGKERLLVYFVGEHKFWDSSEKSILWMELNCYDPDEIVDIDTEHHGAGAVDVEFLPTGFVNLLDAGTRQIVWQQWFPKK